MTAEEKFKQFKSLALCDQAWVIKQLTFGDELAACFATEAEWAEEPWSAIFVGMSGKDVDDFTEAVADYWHTGADGERRHFYGSL